MFRVAAKLVLATFALVLSGGVLLHCSPASALFGALPFRALGATIPDLGYALQASAYPAALPNDGKAESDVTVKVLHGDQPASGVTVTAEVVDGGGSLRRSNAVTDSDGLAHFPYRAGLMPYAGELRFKVQPALVLPPTPSTAPTETPATKLTIPLAPVSYLDIQLVTPEEYEDMRNRRNMAAAVYTLSLNAFPQQLAADGGSMTTVSCILKTIAGKPAAGVALTAKLVSGEGQLLPDGKVTDAQGRLYIDFLAGLTPGTAVIKVTEPSSGLSQSIDITLVKAGPARIKLRYGDAHDVVATREGTFLPADGTTQLALVAEVTDLGGIPLSGVELKLEILGDATNGWIEAQDCKSDASGQVQFAYHSGSQPGKVRIRAYAAGGMEKLTGWQ